MHNRLDRQMLAALQVSFAIVKPTLWEAKTRAILVETAIPTAPMTVGVIHPILEAATLPIRGQEEKSAFGAMAANPTAMPSVAGRYP